MRGSSRLRRSRARWRIGARPERAPDFFWREARKWRARSGLSSQPSVSKTHPCLTKIELQIRWLGPRPIKWLAWARGCDSRVSERGASMNRDPFWLTDERFSRIAPHLPANTRGKARADDQRLIGGIVHAPKSGGRWLDAPPEYGPKRTLHDRSARRADRQRPRRSPHRSRRQRLVTRLDPSSLR